MVQQQKQPKSKNNPRHRGGRNKQSPTESIDNFFQERGGISRGIGTRGLRVIAGRVQEEYLAILKSWQKAVKIYLEMQDDVTIGTLLDAIKLPLLKAKFKVVKVSDMPGDIAAAEWLDSTMHSMDNQTWKSHVTDALESIDFGFAVTEIILEKREDGKLWLKNIDPRGQETLDRWEFEDDDIAITFIQREPVNQQERFVPLDKCVHFTFRGRKGNPMGKPLLRSVYRPWRFAKDLENLEGIGIERDVGGMPVAEIPAEGNVSSGDITKMKAALEALRMDEAMYLLAPGGIKITPYGGGSKMYDVAAVIDRKKKEILGRFFAQFLMLGMGAVGTQALVKGSQDFFTIAIEGVQEMLLEGWNLQLVPYLFSFNTFPGMTGLPKIDWLPPGKEDIAALMNAISTGVSTKIITPTDEDEDNIRDRLDLPELSEEERGEPREPESAPFPGAFEIRPKKEIVDG